MTEPMTAAEYRSHLGVEPVTDMGRRLLAALREREALLGERAEWGKLSGQTIQDAAVGALVRRIREHPAVMGRPALTLYTMHGSWSCIATEAGFTETLVHLDSLLPKEPEWTDAPSGRQFRVDGEKLFARWAGSLSRGEKVASVEVHDAPVVAALLARQEGK